MLLVEDEAPVRLLAQRILLRAGYPVLSAADGAQALHLADTHAGSIDVLVSDVVMPGTSGRELFARLSAAGRCDRVLYTSGYPDDEILRRGLAPRDAPYLEKPFSGEQLTASVQAVIVGRGNA